MERVLVVDDSLVFRKVIKATLETAGYEVLTAENGGKAMQLLQEEGSPDIILLDRVMPDMDGVEVCKWARNHFCNLYGTSYKYFIILTSKNTQDDVLEGFGIGADDYVIKPFCNQELLARLTVACRVLKMQRELLNAAIRDALTGLYNRRSLYDLLGLELLRARREQSNVAVALVDVDRFKQINDTYGHAIGDEMLIMLAAKLRMTMRDFDIVGRLGGEEFVLAFGCMSVGDALVICERVRRGVAEISINCEETVLSMTISIGVAIAIGETEPAKVIRYADKAMYQAKENGRNCVVAYEYTKDG